MSLLDRSRPRDGLATPPQAIRWHQSFGPRRRRYPIQRRATGGERVLAAIIILGGVVSALLAVTLGLVLLYVCVQLGAEILRLLRGVLTYV
jgi:hypothetical protein